MLDHGVSTISQSHPAQSEPSSKLSISKLFSISFKLCRCLSKSIIRAAPPSSMAPDSGLVCPLDAIKTFLTAHLTRSTILINHFVPLLCYPLYCFFQRSIHLFLSFHHAQLTVALLCRDESFLTAENWDLLHSQQVVFCDFPNNIRRSKNPFLSQGYLQGQYGRGIPYAPGFMILGQEGDRDVTQLYHEGSDGKSYSIVYINLDLNVRNRGNRGNCDEHYNWSLSRLE